jgi:putative inorganic carbon (hco3(-)) transporter
MSEVAIPKKKPSYVLMTLLALTFAYIITKDVQIPRVVIITVGAIIGIFLLIRSMSRPELVTYALVAYLPFSRELAGDFAMAFNITNVLMGFIMIVWFSGKYSHEEPLWLRTPLNFPIVLFILIGLLSVIRGSRYDSEYILYGVVNFKRWITPIFMFFLVLNTVKEKQTIQNISIIMMIVTAIVSLMAIYDYHELGSVSSLEKSRIGGICDQPNMLAAFFNYYMFLPFGFFLLNKSKSRYWLLLIPFLLEFRGIMVTFSRGGYIAFAAALYAIAFFRSKFVFITLLFLTWLAVLFPQIIPGGVRYRMGQTIEKPSYSQEWKEESLDASAHTRVEIWKAGLEMVKEHPFFGVGYGLFESYLPLYWSGGARDAHNTYLIVAAEMGIPALIVFLWIVWRIFLQTLGLYLTTQDVFSKALALGFLGGLFGLLMSNMFGSRLDSQEVSSYFWILAALIMRLKIIEQKQSGAHNSEREFYRRLHGRQDNPIAPQGQSLENSHG